MRSYAERLAKAMPERFVFTEGANGGRWYVGTRDDDIGIDYASKSAEQWAFWGPLADELKVDDVSRECEYDHDEGVQGVTCRFSTLLEATAEAVCQEAERMEV